MNIIGRSNQECRIIVNDEDYDKAIELISVFLEKDKKNINDKPEEDISKGKKLDKARLASRIIGWSVIVILIIIIISLIIFSIKNS